MENDKKFCEQILREEYSDYDRNKWHYERELRMLILAYQKGVVFTLLGGDGKENSHESSGLNKPDVTVSLPLSNEQILKGIQTSPRYQLPKEWLKNEHNKSAILNNDQKTKLRR